MPRGCRGCRPGDSRKLSEITQSLVQYATLYGYDLQVGHRTQSWRPPDYPYMLGTLHLIFVWYATRTTSCDRCYNKCCDTPTIWQYWYPMHVPCTYRMPSRSTFSPWPRRLRVEAPGSARSPRTGKKPWTRRLRAAKLVQLHGRKMVMQLLKMKKT